MLTTQPLCTSAELNLEDRVLGKIEKKKLYCFARQRGTLGPSVSQNYVSQLWEDLMRSFIAMAKGRRVSGEIKLCAGGLLKKLFFGFLCNVRYPTRD